MGLGKTLQTLTWLLWLRALPDFAGTPSLVVCPKSVTDNWISEATKFFAWLARARARPWSLRRGAGRRRGPRRILWSSITRSFAPSKRRSVPRHGTPRFSTKRSISRIPIRRLPGPRGPCAPTTGSRSPAPRSRTACSICGASWVSLCRVSSANAALSPNPSTSAATPLCSACGSRPGCAPLPAPANETRGRPRFARNAARKICYANSKASRRRSTARN